MVTNCYYKLREGWEQKRLTVYLDIMSKKATGRTTKLMRIPIRFESEVKNFIEKLKSLEKQKENTRSETQ